MASTLVKKVMLKIVADDGDSEAKLDKISAKADELGKLHPDIKVRIDSAAATAKVQVLRKELRSAANAADDSKIGLGGRLMALGDGARNISGLSDVMGIFSKDASMGTRVMSGFGAATGLLEAPMSGLIVGAGALASGLVAAGAGAGIFAIVAKQAFSQVSTNIAAISKAQEAIASGDTGKKLVADNKAIAASLKGLTGPQKELVTGAGNAELAWHQFITSSTGGVDKVLAPALGLIPKALALAKPFLTSTETALTHIVSAVSGKIGSGSFIHEIGDFAKASGPDLEKVATAAGHVALGVLGILHAFLPMSGTVLGGLDKITAKFEHWGQTLTSHSGFQSLMSMAKADMPYVITIVKNLGEAFGHLGGSMTGLSTFSNSKALLQLATPISQLVNWLSKANPDLLRLGLYALAAHSAFGKVSGAVSGIKTGLGDLDKGVTLVGKFGGAAEDASRGAKLAAGATKLWRIAQAALDIVLDANPISLIVIGIGLLVAGIVLLLVKCKPFREFWIKLWHDAQHIFSVAISWIKTHWELLPEILLGPMAPLAMVITLAVMHFTKLRTGVLHVITDVISWFRALPGRILSAVGNLGSLLLDGGKNLIMGLVHGIESVAMAPVHAVESIVSDVRSLLPFSPAKKGPLSGSGSPDLAGKKIALMLAGGIRQSSPQVAAAARAMAGAAAVHSGGAGGTAGGGTVHVQLEFAGGSGDQQILTALGRAIRIRGGSVQQVLGH